MIKLIGRFLRRLRKGPSLEEQREIALRKWRLRMWKKRVLFLHEPPDSRMFSNQFYRSARR